MFGCLCRENYSCQNLRKAAEGIRIQKERSDSTDKRRKFEAGWTQEVHEHGGMGGVVFIDEAYQLDPMSDSQGKAIVNQLLLHLEDDRDKISFIMAGYDKEMAERFLCFNPGLGSRTCPIQFEDYTDVELTEIWKDLLLKEDWILTEGSISTVAIRRLARGKGRHGFGNARAVRSLFEKATERAFHRDDFDPDMRILTMEDVLGARPDPEHPRLQEVLRKLDGMIGWNAVKSEVWKMINLAQSNYDREVRGDPPMEFSKNRLFLGNPGTGTVRVIDT